MGVRIFLFATLLWSHQVFAQVVYVSEDVKGATGFTSGDFIAAISGLIALGALGFTYLQLRQNQKHNELSVRPLLDFDFDIWKPDGQAAIWLSNDGYGAAILKELSATYEGATFNFLDPNSLRNFSKTMAMGAAFQTEELHQIVGNAIPHGSRKALILIKQDTSKSYRMNLHAAKGLVFQVTYEDLYGNSFERSFESDRYGDISVADILPFS
jgi:hypothetical protein